MMRPNKLENLSLETLSKFPVRF
jgi:hypothetical protein